MEGDYGARQVLIGYAAYSVNKAGMMMGQAKIGQREIATDEFKTILGLEGRYEKFSALERYVISPSVTQVNEHSDIFVSWSPRKTGRKISHLVFTIRYAKESVVPPAVEEKTKKQKAKSLSKALSEAEMASMASPGETWSDLKSRLKREGRGDLFPAKG